MSTSIARTVVTPADLIGKRVYWIVAFTYAGATHYISDTALDLESAEGVIQVYPGLLTQLQFEQALSLFSASVEGISLSMQLHLPVAVAALVSRGFPLPLATGEVAIHIEGNTWEQRISLCKGEVLDPVYGAADEPISFTLEQKISQDIAQIPSPTQVVSLESWPNAAAAAIGKYYPLVFGKPGPYTYPGGSAGVSGSPARFVDTTGDKLLIAGHHVVASTVQISDGTTDENFSVINTTDGLGQKCALVDITGAVSITIDPTLDYHTSWNHTSGGALKALHSTLTLEGAGDLLEWLLTQSTLTYDAGRFAALKPALNGFKLAGYIDAPIAPWEWVQANLLPILPLSLVAGAEGVYGVLWEYGNSLDPALVAVDLEVGVNALRVSMVEYTNSTIVTFKLEYAMRSRTGQLQTYQVRAPALVAGDSKVSKGLYCAQANTRKTKGVKTISSYILYDGATVQRVLAWQERAFAQDSRLIRYLVDPLTGATLTLGQVVRVIDEELYINQIGRVEALSYGLESTELAIRLIEDIALALRGL